VLSLLSVLSATFLVANAQTFNQVKVHLPYTVVIGSKQLAPGDYEILPVTVSSGKLLGIYSDDRRAYEALLPTAPATEAEPAESTKLILHDDGHGEYTLDQMWIQGNDQGYEILSPKSGAARERQASSVEIKAESSR